MPDRPTRRTLWLALGALALLALGAAVYVLDRPPGTAAALPRELSLYTGQSWFGWVGGWLPSFVHALAFSVLTALTLPPTRRHAAWACGAWAGVETAFEGAQHPSVSPLLAAWLEPWTSVPGVGVLRRYFIAGSFSALDVAAGLAGAAAAYAALRWWRGTGAHGSTAHADPKAPE